MGEIIFHNNIPSLVHYKFGTVNILGLIIKIIKQVIESTNAQKIILVNAK